MKTYKIPVTWTTYAVVEVKADSIEDAMDDVEQGGLPEGGSYIDGSFEIDQEGLGIYNKE